MIKNITLIDGIETITATFGTGDIKVTNGVCPEDKTPMLYLYNGEKAVIGTATNEGMKEDSNGNLRIASDGIRFIFPKKESIDILINNLNECKSLFYIDKDERVAKIREGYIR